MRGKGWLRGVVLGGLGILMGVQSGFGAGFALYEGSARGNALGGAMVGRADDPSALFFNPAGITQLPGLQMMAGATAILPVTDVKTTDSSGVTLKTTTEENVWVPPQFYTTYQFSDAVWFGLGVFSPFGLGTEFSQDWPGRFNNYKAVIQTLTVNPNIALKLNDKVSVAAGMEVMWFDLDLRQKIAATANTPQGPVSLGEVDQILQGDSYGYGFNLGMHYRACDWFSLGVSYRSQIQQRVDGDADFTKPDLLSLLSPASFPDTGASGTILLPDMLFFGAAFYPIQRLSIEVGGVWTRWSTFDALTISYEDPIGVNPQTGAPITTVSRKKDWGTTWRFNVGAEYEATDWLDLRVGYVFDEEPVPDEHADYLVPANDRHLFNCGPGFHWRNWALDLSYTYIYITDRDVEARPEEGIFDSEFSNGHAHLVGLSLGYKF